MINEYIRLSENYKYNQLIPANDSPYKYIKNKNSPYFVSMLRYNEDVYKEYQKTKTLAGVSGGKTHKIWADFDSEDDLGLAFADAITFVMKLNELGIEEESIQISFSGNKGIGVIVETENDYTIEQVKSFVYSVAKSDTPRDKDGQFLMETFDTSMYDHQRIFRLNFTKNEKTGLYKIPITWEELGEANIEEIKERAKIPPTQEEIDDVNAYYQVSSFKIPDEYLNITKLEPVKSEPVVIGAIDWSAKPKFLSNCRWALQNGMFEPGFRSEPLLCLASTYKNLGYAQGITYRMLKGVAELESQRNNSERYNDKELYNNIVLQVYSDRWKNGQFSCKEPGNFLYDYCNSLGDHSCKHDKKANETRIRTLVDLAPKFKEYVKNIDKNTILTGIPSIDKNVFISTGANVGIIGAAGCHAKGTKILMHDGSTKNVEDVNVGDKLMGPDSKPREVLVLRRGKEEMVKIIPVRGEPFIVNKSHILHLTPSYLKQNKSIPGNLNITVKNYITGVKDRTKTVLGGYKLLKTGVEFPINDDLKIDPYILGLWLGDGSSDSISLTTMDEKLKNEWLKFGEKFNLKYTSQKQENNKATTYHLNNGREGGKTNELLQIFKDYNLLNNKHIPDVFLRNSKQNRLKLLAGLIDSDGYLESNKKGYEFSQKSEKLAKQVVFLARSLGFHASINARKKSCNSKGIKVWGDYFSVYLSANNLEILPVRLERKKASKKIMKNNVLHYGFKYEILPEDEYFGFTLDKDHLYLTDDFFIHHNSGKTSLALDILNNTSKAGVKTVVASLDMAENRMFEKVMYRISQLPRDQLYKIYQDDNEAKLLEKLKTEFGNTYFFQKSMATVSDIREHILDIQDSTGDKVKLVMIDYFERIMSDMSDDTAASKRISGELQDLVNDLDIALITLVQPNKFSIAGGPDKPIRNYTSIKGSSHLYQSFRIIMSLWRPFYTPLLKDHDHYMQMAVLKNDLGELNEFVFNWDGKKGSISEMEDFQKEEFFSLLRQKESDEGNDDNGGWQS